MFFFFVGGPLSSRQRKLVFFCSRPLKKSAGKQWIFASSFLRGPLVKILLFAGFFKRPFAGGSWLWIFPYNFTSGVLSWPPVKIKGWCHKKIVFYRELTILWRGHKSDAGKWGCDHQEKKIWCIRNRMQTPVHTVHESRSRHHCSRAVSTDKSCPTFFTKLGSCSPRICAGIFIWCCLNFYLGCFMCGLLFLEILWLSSKFVFVNN